MLTNGALVQYITFRVFPVGYPHRADAVRLRGQVLEVDHHCVASMGHDDWTENACNQKIINGTGLELRNPLYRFACSSQWHK